MIKIAKTIRYVHKYGWIYTRNKALRKIGIHVSTESDYKDWLNRHSPTKRELNSQTDAGRQSKLFFDLVYTGNSEGIQLIKSWKRQSWPNRGMVVHLNSKEKLLSQIAELKSEAVVFSCSNTILEPNLLYEYAKVLDSNPNKILVYTDEDCITFDGKHRNRPYFKPDVSPELLHAFQYIGGTFVVRRRTLLNALKESEKENLEKGCWYGLLLCIFTYIGAYDNFIDKKTDNICMAVPDTVNHIPKVLFSNSVSRLPEGIFISTEDCQQVLSEHLKSIGRIGSISTLHRPQMMYHMDLDLPAKEPLVSIIIPNKDHVDDLLKCIGSIEKVNTYSDYEIIIAENNSEEENTFQCYEKLTGQKYSDEEPLRGFLPGGQYITVVTWKGEFNYSKINNYAERYAQGDMILLLNNDTEIIEPDSIREMVSSCLLPNIGACGAKLFYSDGTIQHAGVVFGIGGFAANVLTGELNQSERLLPYSVPVHEMSACTAACLMIRREVFQEVHGLDEQLAVSLNDVDLCLRIRKAGYKILMNPYARLYHYESKSRGAETGRKAIRFHNEIIFFQNRWKAELKIGDPYYNSNLTLRKADYSLALDF